MSPDDLNESTDSGHGSPPDYQPFHPSPPCDKNENEVNSYSKVTVTCSTPQQYLWHSFFRKKYILKPKEKIRKDWIRLSRHITTHYFIWFRVIFIVLKNPRLLLPKTDLIEETNDVETTKNNIQLSQLSSFQIPRLSSLPHQLTSVPNPYQILPPDFSKLHHNMPMPFHPVDWPHTESTY